MYSHVVAHNYRVCICMQKEPLDHKILFEHSLPIFDGLNDKNYKVSHINFVHMWTLNTWMSVCQCYNTSAVARAVAIGCSEVALQVNVSVVRAQNIRE